MTQNHTFGKIQDDSNLDKTWYADAESHRNDDRKVRMEIGSRISMWSCGTDTTFRRTYFQFNIVSRENYFANIYLHVSSLDFAAQKWNLTATRVRRASLSTLSTMQR